MKEHSAVLDELLSRNCQTRVILLWRQERHRIRKCAPVGSRCEIKMAEPIALCGNNQALYLSKGALSPSCNFKSRPGNEKASYFASSMVIGSPRPGVTRLSPFRHSVNGEC